MNIEMDGFDVPHLRGDSATRSPAPRFTPHGRLLWVQADDAPLPDAAAAGRLQAAFAQGSGTGLLQLSVAERRARAEREVARLRKQGAKSRRWSVSRGAPAPVRAPASTRTSKSPVTRGAKRKTASKR